MSQRVVRRVVAENYEDTPDGIPGNDDCGDMSSWVVLSMMGVYTVDPASLSWELVSPVFPGSPFTCRLLRRAGRSRSKPQRIPIPHLTSRASS